MRDRRLGQSPLQIHPVVFGAWAIGGWHWGGSNDAAATAAIHASIDAGVASFDTAPIYGFGHSERVLGRALAGRIHGVQVFTKVGLRWDDDRGSPFFQTAGPDGKPVQVYRNLRPDSIRTEVERSLRRLGRPVIDLLQIHWPDPSTPVEESLGAMARLVEEGKVRAIGVSNFDVEGLRRSRAALADRGLPLASDQPRYSLMDRRIEAEVLPWLRQNKVGCLVYSPLEQGLLTGKVGLDREFPKGDGRAVHPAFQPAFRAAVLDRLSRLGDLAEARGASLGQLALAWCLHQPGVSAVLVGARTPGQAVENARAAHIVLDLDEIARVGGLFADLPTPGL